MKYLYANYPGWRSNISLFLNYSLRASIACLAMMLCEGQAQAAIFWTEDWEDSPDAIRSYAANRWYDTDCPQWPDNPLGGGLGRTTAVAYSGSRSLQWHFTGSQWDPSTNPRSCSASRYFKGSDEVWMRWFEYWGSGMKTESSGTKRHYMYGNYGYYGHCFGYYNGGKQLSLVMQSVYEASDPWNQHWATEVLSHNATPFNMPENQWVCYEAHMKYNTPGQADGVYEAFATNMTAGGPTIQFAKYTGRNWRGSSPNDPLPPSATWATWKVYTQDGMGDIYDDDYAIGNTRCGCGKLSPTGIPDRANQKPIPAGRVNVETKAGVVRLTLPWQGSYSIAIHDMKGRLVWKQAGNSGSLNAVVGVEKTLNEGVYIARVAAGQNTASTKFVLIK